MRIATLYGGRIKCFHNTYNSNREYFWHGNPHDAYLAHNAANTDEAVNLFCILYNVKSFESYQFKFDAEKYEKYQKNQYTKPYNCMTAFYANHKVYDLMAKSGQQYDVVVRYRADIILKEPLLLQMPDVNTVYIPSCPNCQRPCLCKDHTGINDQIAYGDMESMRKYCAAFPLLDTYLEEGTLLHPETLNLINLQKQGLCIKRFPLSYELDAARV